MAHSKPKIPRPTFSACFVKDEKTGRFKGEIAAPSASEPGRLILQVGATHRIFPTDDGFGAEFWINPSASDHDIRGWFLAWAKWHIYDFLESRRKTIEGRIRQLRDWSGGNKEDLARELKLAIELRDRYLKEGNTWEYESHQISAKIFGYFLARLRRGATNPISPAWIRKAYKAIYGVELDMDRIKNTVYPRIKRKTGHNRQQKRNRR